jgi:hypothetical protein
MTEMKYNVGDTIYIGDQRERAKVLSSFPTGDSYVLKVCYASGHESIIVVTVG